MSAHEDLQKIGLNESCSHLMDSERTVSAVTLPSCEVISVPSKASSRRSYQTRLRLYHSMSGHCRCTVWSTESTQDKTLAYTAAARSVLRALALPNTKTRGCSQPHKDVTQHGGQASRQHNQMNENSTGAIKKSAQNIFIP